jgi:hypothetical protein
MITTMTLASSKRMVQPTFNGKELPWVEALNGHTKEIRRH